MSPSAHADLTASGPASRAPAWPPAGLLLQRLLALAIAVFVASQVADFPASRTLLVAILGAYAAALWRSPLAWLVVLPALIPVLDLTPSSGRILWNEFDFLALLSIAGCLWHGLYGFTGQRVGLGAFVLVSALIATEIVATARGLLTLADLPPTMGPVYYDNLNPLRVLRGFAWAVLLFPALNTLVRRNAPVARALVAGMLLGLAACALSVVWERLLFPGPFDFAARYRVTGLFAGMHTGGAFLDAFLAMSVPFFAAGFYLFRGRLVRLASGGLFLLGVHALVVTYSRTNLALLALTALVFVVRDLAAGLRDGRVSRRAVTSILLVVAMLVVASPVVGGAFFKARLESVREDLATRARHWSDALDLMQGGLDWMLGAGKGTFPRAYRMRAGEQDALGSYSLESERGQRFLRLTRSDALGTLYVRQRFSPREPGTHRLTLKLRTWASPPDKLLIEFCERNILQPRSTCQWLGLRAAAAPAGEWQTHHKTVSLRRFGHDRPWLARPVEISLLNRGLTGRLDIGTVQLTSPGGSPLLDNPDFSRGMDHWFFSSGSHLPWHIKNLWVSTLHDGGVLGVLALLAAVLWIVARLAARVLGGDPFAAILLASTAGLLVVGLFDSPFDEPRIAFVFYTIAFVTLRGVEFTAPSAAGALPWGRLLFVLVLIGAATTAAGITWLAYSRDMSVHQVVRIGVNRLGVNWPWLEAALTPDPRYVDQPLDGRIPARHPRILMPELAHWNGDGPAPTVARRWQRYEGRDRELAELACRRGDPMSLAACYLGTGEDARARALLTALQRIRLREPAASGDVGDLWQLALGYDLLHTWPALPASDRLALEQRIGQQVARMLEVLDDSGAALWHTRASLAASAWLGAIALDPGRDGNASLQRRAQGHLLDNLSALVLTEAWPEGYSYWVNNRGLLMALAAAAYINGLEGAQRAEAVRDLLRRTGLWTIHATRPDSRVEGLGDEGPRVDLKDETRRVIDVIAQVTRDPVLAGYSAFLGNLHVVGSYYRSYRGEFALFNDPTVTTVGAGTLASLGAMLPRAELFGRGTMNQVYVRSGWEPHDTFLSFRAGYSISHHGHYDAGHFSLFKGAPLAVNSSTYAGISTENRLHYAIRSVAKNTLLILRPGEVVKPNHLFEQQVADGGQRLTQPTGSSIDSTAAFLGNIRAGLHLEGGEITAFEPGDDHVLVATDLTAAYNSTAFDDTGSGGKVQSVKRTLLYLRDEDRVLVHDDVTATEPSYVKKWLLHTANRPQVENLRVLAGTPDNGILESPARHALVRNGDAALVVDRLFPGDATLRLVGGESYRFYVESDGDESELDGKNFADGASQGPWFDRALWRIEIQPPPLRRRDRFLVALTPALGSPRLESLQPVRNASGTALGVIGATSATLFVDARREGTVTVPGNAWPSRVRVVGLPLTADLTATIDDRPLETAGHGSPVRVLALPREPRRGALTLSWR